ncbi:MAG: hypothetical protein ACR2P8_12500 [Myxococcota bacterium]
MTDRQLVYEPRELLASGDYAEPLIAAGVRCHGGFDADGRYRSPRTLHRAPAIAAWQAQLAEAAAGDGDGLLDIPRSFVPPQFPNVAQAKLLLRNGVREPMVRVLTIISIVEGFGAMIRDVRVPDLAADVVEPVDGTALAHLAGGLFEAHARDESGYRNEGGHKQMWEAARDAALENPKIPSDVLMRLMGRRGQRGRSEPMFPQLGPRWERMIAMMAQVLVIEVFAESTFRWGIELLSDPEVSADPETAGRMVSYIQGDESPHVEYLRTALSELCVRTIRTVDGKTVSGATVVRGMLHRILCQLTATRREEQREELRGGLAAAMQVAPNPPALLEEFDALESDWNPPETTGFEPVAEA